MSTKSQKSFDMASANLTEINRELKRLASRKCRAKTVEDRKSAEKAYAELAQFKSEKFATTRKSYMTFTDEEIANLDLETTVKAIKSLQSRRCIYPEKSAETVQMEQKFQMHRAELAEKALLDKLREKYA